MSDVEVTRDMAHAKVFVTALMQERSAEAVKGLKELAWGLRMELARRVKMRHVPELHFHYDDSVDRGERIETLLRDNPPSPGPTTKPDTSCRRAELAPLRWPRAQVGRHGSASHPRADRLGQNSPSPPATPRRMIYLHQIDPIIFSLGPVKLHWYGLMYLLAFITAWWLGRLRASQGRLPGVNADAFSDLLFYAMLGVVLGGRIGYVLFYGFGTFLDNPLSIFKVWEGGMSFHGGLLGVMAAALWWSRKHGCISSTRWISWRRWCRRAWASAVSAISSVRSCGASRRTATGA